MCPKVRLPFLWHPNKQCYISFLQLKMHAWWRVHSAAGSDERVTSTDSHCLLARSLGVLLRLPSLALGRSRLGFPYQGQVFGQILPCGVALDSTTDRVDTRWRSHQRTPSNVPSSSDWKIYKF